MKDIINAYPMSSLGPEVDETDPQAWAVRPLCRIFLFPNLTLFFTPVFVFVLVACCLPWQFGTFNSTIPFVYSISNGSTISQDYTMKAYAVCQRQVALAGYRLVSRVAVRRVLARLCSRR